jgi:uncharacterized protein
VPDLQFEWDEAKSQANQRKHGVGFNEAARVFFDPLCISLKDRIVDGEQRWRTYGEVDGLIILLVAYTVREENQRGQQIEVIRLISARRATRKERQLYEEENC